MRFLNTLANPEKLANTKAHALNTPRLPLTQPGKVEFVVLAAILMSIVALSVDIMLPAFGAMSDHFGLTNDNDRQAIITVLFAGLMVGQLVFGPLSDYIGRKPAILIGIGFHITGSLMCLFAPDYMVLLLGRFLQGFGGAGPRIAIVALIRDRFEGPQMAQIISIVLTIFILVPTFAPAIGQAVLVFAPWQALFGVLLAMALLGGTWLTVRQPETHTQRAPFNGSTLLATFRLVLTTPITMLYAMAAGCAFGTLLSYIVSSQQILQDFYGTGDLFALYFGLTAIFVALSNTVNAWLVGRYKMETITATAIGIQVVWSLGFLGWITATGTPPSLAVWMVYISVTLFLVGMTFGNYNAIALRPLGKVAGVASSITASVQTLISVGVAAIIGAAFAMNVTPVVVGSALMGVIASGLMILARRFESRAAQSSGT